MCVYTNTYFPTTITNLGIKAHIPADGQTFGRTHSLMEHCVRLYFSQASDDIIMIMLERFKHCNTHTYKQGHAGVTGVAEPAWVHRL